jgi:hypothetical protein
MKYRLNVRIAKSDRSDPKSWQTKPELLNRKKVALREGFWA